MFWENGTTTPRIKQNDSALPGVSPSQPSGDPPPLIWSACLGGNIQLLQLAVCSILDRVYNGGLQVHSSLLGVVLHD